MDMKEKKFRILFLEKKKDVWTGKESDKCTKWRTRNLKITACGMLYHF